MRFWVALVVLAAINLAGWMVDWRSLLHRAPALTVEPVAFAADGEIPAGWDSRGYNLRLRFSRAMATGGTVAPGAFTPAIAGSWAWDDDTTLAFRLEAPLAGSRRYTLALDPARLATADGSHLPGPVQLRFTTAPLRLEWARAVDRDDSGREVIGLCFNQPVLPQEVARAVRLTHADGSPMPVVNQGDAPSPLVHLLTPPLPDRHIEIGLHLAKGFAGTEGPLGLELDTDLTLELSTAVVCSSASFAQWQGWGEEDPNCLSLFFNRPMEPDVLKQVLQIEPAVAVSPEPHNSYDDASCVRLRGVFTPGVRYAISFATPPTGTGRLPVPDTVYATAPDRRPSCDFVGKGGHLGSGGNRAVAVKVVNLRQVRIRAWQVYANNLAVTRSQYWIRNLAKPVADRVLPVAGAPNQELSLRVALDDLLGKPAADGVYYLELSADPHDVMQAGYHGWISSDQCTISLSDLALSARQGRDEVVVWATSLSSGKPVPGVRVDLVSVKQQPLGGGVTAADGLVHLAARPDPDDHPGILVAHRDGSEAGLTWLDLDGSPLRDPQAETGGRPWTSQEAYLHPDRGLLRPGETSHWRAIVRSGEGAVPAAFPVRWTAWKPDGRAFLSSDAVLDRDGCASLDLELPDTAMTGRWRITLAVPGGDELGSDSLQVEDFIPDRLEVGLDLPVAGDEPRLPAAPVMLDVHGAWLFGSPASGLAATLAARLDPQVFRHPSWADWWSGDEADLGGQIKLGGTATGERIEGLADARLDAAGRTRFPLDLATELAKQATGAPARPWRLALTASVLEAGGRAVSAARTAIIDPVPAYLLMRPGKAATGGSTVPIELRLVRPDGAQDGGAAKAQLRLFRLRYETSVLYENGHYDYHSTRLLTLVGAPIEVAIGAGAGMAEVAVPDDGGSFAILAGIPGTPLAVSGYVSASGGDAWQDAIARERPERAEVSLATAIPGGLATPGVAVAFDVKSPFAGTLLLTVETDQVQETRVIALSAPATRVEVMPAAAWGGTAYVTAAIVRPVEADKPWRVHRAYGVCPLRISQEPRRATVAVEAPAEVRPGAALSCAVHVSDPGGVPLADAAVTVAAVDEGILRPSAFRTPDPFAFFCAKRLLGVAASDAYADLMPEVPRPAGEATPGGDEAVSVRHRPPVSARRVVPVALWSGVVRTGPDGTAHADFTVPESFSGKLRIMAVAAAGMRTGGVAAPCAVRSPVMVQSSLPRFLAPGDRCRVPVTVFNQGAAASAEVTVAVTGAAGASPATQNLDVPAAGSAVAWIELTAAEAMGTAVITASARIGGESHRERTELAVRPASPVVTMGGATVVTAGMPATLPAVPGFLPGGWHSARLAMGPVPDFGVPRAIEHLLVYPHGCAEQTASACLALVRLPEFLPADARPGVARRLAAGFSHLQLMTTRDGGLAMWPGGRDAWPWASVYALHLCHEAAAAGFPVPAQLRDGLIGYATAQLVRTDSAELPTRCYAAFVLALHGRPQPVALARLANQLHREGRSAQPECFYQIALAWLVAGDRERGAAALPVGVMPRSGRLDGGTCGSELRDRALQLLTMLRIDPANADVLRLASGLSEPKSWYSTQDTAWAVLALGSLRAALPPQPYTSAEIASASGVMAAGTGTLSWSGDVLPSGLNASITGPAGTRAFLWWTASGIPTLPPAAVNAGLTASRSWSVEPGHLRRGDLVTVTLTLRAPDDQPRLNVVMEDLLPAGLEVENAHLETSAAQPANTHVAVQDAKAGETAPSHVEIRDDRLVVVGDLPGHGVLVHRYLARAVAAGHFTQPPLQAECMYDRTVRSVSGGGTVEIGER